MKEKIYLVHGLMGTAQQHFTPQIQILKESYDVITVDLPGHGDNPLEAPNPFFQSTLNWLYKKIKEEGPGHMIGLSMGATLGIHLAIEHPNLLNSVILTGYTPRVPEYLKDIMIDQYHNFINIKENNPEVAKQFESLHGKRWFSSLSTVLESFTFHYPDVTDSMIKKIEIPMLILNGSNEKHERDAVCHLTDLNPNITAGLIPKAGHTANLDQSEVYNLILLDFLDNNQVTDLDQKIH